MPAVNNTTVNSSAVNGGIDATDTGSITSSAATPLTATERLTYLDGGSITSATVTPLTATELETPLDGGSITAVSATPLTASELLTYLDSGSITAATVTPLTVTLQKWHINGRSIRAEAISANAQTLSLTFQVPASDRSEWRRYDRAGDLAIQTGFGGTFRAIDRAGRSNPVVIEPPTRQSPPFPTDDYYITSYQEDQQAPDRLQIALTAQRLSNRDSVFSAVSESGDWEFDVLNGTVGLDSGQVSTLSGSGTTTGPQYSLTVRVDDDQAATLLDSFGYPDGLARRTVGDGQDFIADESPDSRHSLSLSTPSGAVISDGTYYVASSRIDENSKETSKRWQVELELEE